MAKFTKAMAMDWLGHHALAIQILVEALAPVAGVSTTDLTRHVFQQAKEQWSNLSSDEVLAIISRQLDVGTSVAVDGDYLPDR